MFASDIETCKHVSASLGSFVIPLTGLDSCGSAIRMSILILAALALRVIPATKRESPFLGLLVLFYYGAYRALFVFMPARFAVIAPKINDLQMTFFPFFFGKSFF